MAEQEEAKKEEKVNDNVQTIAKDAPITPQNEPNLIEEAKKAKMELDATILKMQEERKKMEKLQADMIVGGRSIYEPPKVETPQEKIKRETLEYFKGTNIEEAIRKYG